MSILTRTALVGALVAACVLPSNLAHAAVDAPPLSTDPTGSLSLLTDPYLQSPSKDGVVVSWASTYPGERHVVLVGAGVAALSAEEAVAAARGVATPADVRATAAETSKFSRLADNINWRRTPRDAWRHEARVTGLTPGEKVPYRVVSISGAEWVVSGTFSLTPAPRVGDDLTILLTSDHQAMANTPANLQKAAETLGDIDAVFMAGDLVNHPDAGRQWFEDGTSFFNALQGNASRDAGGVTYRGAEILQNTPIFPAVGNHEVQGRIAGPNTYSMADSYNSPTPRDVAERVYERDAARINPTGDPAVREKWIEDHSWSTTTYEEMFALPTNSHGDETYYATTVGDVRLISLFSTRIWRSANAQPDPATRDNNAQRYSRFQERPGLINDEIGRNYGSFPFEDLAVGSAQHEWLKAELASEEFQNAPYRVVMLHEGPQGLGDNVDPPFTNPVETRETDANGNLVGIRYEYPKDANILLNDVQPILEEAGVDLVFNGHSHVWNRFEAPSGTSFLETSNVGNSYGAFDPTSGRSRPLPPAPWDASNYTAQGNPGGLAPITPNIAPHRDQNGVALPFISSNDHAVFSVLRTGTGEISSYSFDVRTPDVAPVIIDTFTVGEPAIAEPDPTSMTDGDTVEDRIPEISGTGVPGARVTMTGDATGSADVAADGTWRLATDLRPGIHDLTFTQTISRRTSPPADITVTVVPAPPIITAPAEGNEYVVDEAPDAITGNGAEGATVHIEINGESLGTATVVDGSWMVPSVGEFAPGEHLITARQTLAEQTSRDTTATISVTALPVPSPTPSPSQPTDPDGTDVAGTLANTGATVPVSLIALGAIGLIVGALVLLRNARQRPKRARG